MTQFSVYRDPPNLRLHVNEQTSHQCTVSAEPRYGAPCQRAWKKKKGFNKKNELAGPSWKRGKGGRLVVESAFFLIRET